MTQFVGNDLIGNVVGQLHGPIRVDQTVLQAQETVVLEIWSVQEVNSFDDVFREGNLKVPSNFQLPIEQHVLFGKFYQKGKVQICETTINLQTPSLTEHPKNDHLLLLVETNPVELVQIFVLRDFQFF